MTNPKGTCHIDHPGSCAPCGCKDDSLTIGVGLPRPQDCRDRKKSWSANRNGDPRQLLYEATGFEAIAKRARRDAALLRVSAQVVEARADHYEEVARDYRCWAEERK